MYVTAHDSECGELLRAPHDDPSSGMPGLRHRQAGTNLGLERWFVRNLVAAGLPFLFVVVVMQSRPAQIDLLVGRVGRRTTIVPTPGAGRCRAPGGPPRLVT